MRWQNMKGRGGGVFLIAVCAVMGALILAGLVIVVVVLGGIAGASVPYVGYVVEKWTLEGVIQAFVSAALVGGVCGAGIGWFLWRLEPVPKPGVL